MAASVAAPRYSAEDFETTSIHSAAPSYVSDVPSYHSIPPYQEAAPPYTPRENRDHSGTPTTTGSDNPRQTQTRPASQQQTIGLPPVPAAPPIGVPNLHNFRIPNWSTHNAPAARQLHSVIERRVNAGVGSSPSGSGSGGSSSSNSSVARRYNTLHRSENSSEDHILRPLEDPYLVGERAAARAKSERLARENGDDILQREDKQWDWMLAQMRDWDAREKSFAKFRRETDPGHRKKLLRRLGGRLV